MENENDGLHIFFLPLLAPGHMIPMVDLAKLFAIQNIKCTILTTTKNAALIKPSISNTKIQLLTLPFANSVHENIANFPTPDLNPDFIQALKNLKDPFTQFVNDRKPDCIVSDIFYPWTSDVALQHAIPRISFHGSCIFSSVIMGIIGEMSQQGNDINDEDTEFVISKIQSRICLRKSMIPRPASLEEGDMFVRIMQAQIHSYGTIYNTFADLEGGYGAMIKERSWLVGPVSTCNRDMKETSSRGGEFSRPTVEIMDWLDNKKADSVLYICFGSLTRFTKLQLHELAEGLEEANHPFIWVVKKEVELLEGFEEKVGKEGRGVIIRGWAPQWAILNHSAVGAFMTHCGWNSCMEGVTAGVSMVTWPQFAEQFINERLLVDVLNVGVSLGAKVCSPEEERRSFIKGAEVAKAVNEVMVNNDLRKKVKGIAEKAIKATEEGGSSRMDMKKLVRELVGIKKTGSFRGAEHN